MTTGKPPPAKATTQVGYDPLLDPLPKPEVVESDTETAWGRWEESLKPELKAELQAQDKTMDFEQTLPMNLADLTELLKKGKPGD